METEVIEPERTSGENQNLIQERLMRNCITERSVSIWTSFCRDVLPPVTDCVSLARIWTNLEKLDAEIASALNKIIQNARNKKVGQSRRHRQAQEEDRFVRGRSDRLHDPRLLSSDWRSMIQSLDQADLFTLAQHQENIQEFEFNLRCISGTVCTPFRQVSLINSKLYWNCTTCKFIT